MVELSRTIRFVIPLEKVKSGNPLSRPSPSTNSFAGNPSSSGIGGYQELEVAVRGDVDPTTGYLVNISKIDQVVRDYALPRLWELLCDGRSTSPAAALVRMLEVLQSRLGGSVARIRWRMSPYHVQSMSAAAPELVSIAEQFEFAASHRLNIDSLTPQQNLEIFGKCNNPNGHGHNYRLEPTVAVPVNSPVGRKPFTLHDLERIVNQVILQRFDHKHLNLDTSEFAQLNPSVENIARVCYGLLIEPLASAGGTLQQVTIWETEKTRCTYPAGG